MLHCVKSVVVKGNDQRLTWYSKIICCEYARDIYLSHNVFQWHEDRGAFSCGGNTCLQTNISTVIDIPGGGITFTSKYTYVSENVV